MIPLKMPKGFHGWALLDGEHGCVMLKDTLNNLSIGLACKPEHGKGVITGVMGALMACGMEFEEAAKLVWQCLPTDFHPDAIPEPWRDKFQRGTTAVCKIPGLEGRKVTYLTVDAQTESGLREAERLHEAGWKVLSAGMFRNQFFKIEGATEADYQRILKK